MLSRRGILGGLICAPAIVRASSLMPIKAFFEAAPIIAPSNTLLTINQITREAIRLFANSNAFIQKCNAEYDPEFAFRHSLGSSLKIRLPADYSVAVRSTV